MQHHSRAVHVVTLMATVLVLICSKNERMRTAVKTVAAGGINKGSVGTANRELDNLAKAIKGSLIDPLCCSHYLIYVAEQPGWEKTFHSSISHDSSLSCILPAMGFTGETSSLI